MRTNRAHLLVLAAIACLPLACKDGGCGGGSSSSSSGGATSATAELSASVSASASSVAAAASSSAPKRQLLVHASGAIGALFRAASTLDLTDDQKAKIETIGNDLRESIDLDAGGAPRQEMKAIQLEMVKGVKAGRIDGMKMEGHFQVLEKEAKERHAREAEALGKLHALLDPEQRKKIVESVRKQEDERYDRMKKAEAAQAAHAGDGGRPSPQKRRFERYGRDLDLDADQKKKLEAIIPADDPKQSAQLREDGKKRNDQTLDAFSKEPFVLKDIPPPDVKLVRRPIEEQMKFFNGLLPILKPEQKDKLAARLEKQAEAGPMGMGRGRPGMPGRGDGNGAGEERPHGQPEQEDDSK